MIMDSGLDLFNTFLCNICYWQSVIALSLIYPLHKITRPRFILILVLRCTPLYSYSCQLGNSTSYISSARTPRKTPLFFVLECLFIGSLPSNGCPLFVYWCTHYPATGRLPRICLRRNVFIELLPSNGSILHNIMIFFSFWVWGETESTWYVGHYLAYCTSPGWEEHGAVGGMRIGRETKVLGGNPPQCHFVNHKSHVTCPGLEPGPPRWVAGD
jgi:hypothetical protein